MKNKKTHTPLPWKIREIQEMNLIFIEAPKELIKKPYGQEILSDDYFYEYDKKEDCKLIVKAVNNHEKLIEALKKMHKIAINSTYKLIDFDCDELHNCIDEGTKLLQSIEQQ